MECLTGYTKDSKYFLKSMPVVTAAAIALLLSACGGSNSSGQVDSLQNQTDQALNSEVSTSAESGSEISTSEESSSSNGSNTETTPTDSAVDNSISDNADDVVVEEPPAVEEEVVDPIINDSPPKVEPTILLTSPVNGSTVTGEATLTISANAWDADGSVEKVTFYANNDWIGRDTAAPYSFTLQGLEPGELKIYAIAHDDSELTAKSSVHFVTIEEETSESSPVVSLVSPSEASSILEGESLTIEAEAADDDGSIAKVDFYRNGNKLTSDTTAPFTHTWASPAVGSYDVYAIATDDTGLTSQSNTHNVDVVADVESSGQLVTYAANDTITALHKSNRFGVKVSQGSTTRNSFVYKENNSAEVSWQGGYDYMQDANHWTSFSFDGSVDVEARRLDGANIKTCVIRPKALKIQPTIQGNKCTFRLTEPGPVSVEIDENYEISQHISDVGNITKQIVKHPLLVFANELEESIPSASDANVIYFGPGIHEIGKHYQIPNNTTVYLAGGSYVIGTFVAKNKNPTNVTIRGRGILSGQGLSENNSENNGWNNHAIDFTDGVGGSNILIEGITITEPLRSCILSYHKTTIRNVKLLTWDHRNDGIGSGGGSLIEDNFIKVQDDNIKIYFANQTIKNNVIWQQTSGAVFKFAWELKRNARNNVIQDIDVIHSDVFYDHPSSESDRPDLYSTSAIFSAMGFYNGAAFKNSSFKRIRIEEKHLLRLMALRMVSTHESLTSTTVWGDPSESAVKTIEDITIDDLSLAGIPYKQSTLYGNNGGTIKKITFNNLKINGQVIASKSQLTSRLDGVGLVTAGNVSNITIQP